MSSEKKKILLNEDIEQMETDSKMNRELYQQKRKKYILKGLSSLLSSIIKILN